MASDKHIDAAISVVDSDEFKALFSVGRIGKCVEMFSAALEAAERAGMKRAAEISRQFLCQRQIMIEVEYAVNERFGGDATVDEFVPIIAERLAARILSEAKESE